MTTFKRKNQGKYDQKQLFFHGDNLLFIVIAYIVSWNAEIVNGHMCFYSEDDQISKKGGEKYGEKTKEESLD